MIRQRISFLVVLSTVVFLAEGCIPGDQAMFFQVNLCVLDVYDRPFPGQTVGVIPSHQYRWPSSQNQRGSATAIDPAEYGELFRTDPNGLIEFTVTNTEPVAIPASIFLDMLFPPSVQFLIMLPDREPSGYAVTFVPGGDYGEDRLTYRHFDLKTGRTLRTKYSDVSGGLDIASHKPPRDPNNPWGTPHPSLHIRVLTSENTSAESPAPSGILSGN